MCDLIVDRIIQGVAVCEKRDRTMTEMPLEQLPAGVREGDCLRLEGAGYVVDSGETARRRSRNQALLEKLLEKNNGEKA